MNRVKIVARVLYVLSLILALAYLVTVLYSAICLATGAGITPYGDGQFLHINYPFTARPFLNVDNNMPYLLCSFLLPLTLAGIFFWLMANVFRIFFQPRLFSHRNIMHLRRFYWFNLVVPGLAIIMCSFFVSIEGLVAGLWLLHVILGIFAYFLAAIFKQGLSLQNEQDLFI